MSRPQSTDNLITQAAGLIKKAFRVTAFTGAGISVESGIPPFRGPNGLWHQYNPIFLDIDYFTAHPTESWPLIKEIFYDFFGRATPNPAHLALAQLERQKLVDIIITQNIDNLHQAAGSQQIIEYHGNSHHLVCLRCNKHYPATPDILAVMPPTCAKCGQVLKPDFVFFGEQIPYIARMQALGETRISDVWLIIGTTGEIPPASELPLLAKKNGAKIIEINIQPSKFTSLITDIFLQGSATAMTSALLAHLPPKTTKKSQH
jgi:NAD-dependent deacetylase